MLSVEDDLRDRLAEVIEELEYTRLRLQDARLLLKASWSWCAATNQRLGDQIDEFLATPERYHY